MNKFEIAKGLYRQNIYNVNLGDNHYSHVTCYFDEDKKILMTFKAGENYNMTWFVENEDNNPLKLSDDIVNVIREILLSWPYDHIEAIELYKHESTLWDGIFSITKRDEFVISQLERSKNGKV